MSFKLAKQRLHAAHADALPLVCDEVVRQLEFEHSIRNKIETKAQGALSVAGLCITVFTGFGVKLITDPLSLTAKAPILGVFPWVVPLLFLVPLVLGLFSAMFALHGLRVGNDHQQADYQEVFSEHALKGEEDWHRWMALHVFSVAERQHEHNAARAVWVRKSLRLFAAFLWSIVVVGILLGVSVVMG